MRRVNPDLPSQDIQVAGRAGWRGRKRARRPAPSPHPFWRLIFPLLVVGAALLVFAVWRQGTALVLASNSGQRITTITDPTAPGYRAFVEPTPTLLVAHIGSNGDLVGATVLAQTALSEGGAAVFVSAEMLIEAAASSELEDDLEDDLAGGSMLLREVFAGQGLDGLSASLAELFGFGFQETIELDVLGMANFVSFVEPLPIALSDALVVPTGDGLVQTIYGVGAQELSAAQVAEVYGWLNPGEFDANRTLRQHKIWEVWLDAIPTLGPATAENTSPQQGLSAYLRSLGNGERRLEILPLEAVPSDESAYYVQTDEQRLELASIAREIVPLPVAPEFGGRPRVSLLDGIGNQKTRDELLVELIDAGAEVTIVGNAQAFDAATTTVDYHRAELEQRARMLANAISAGVRFVNDPSQLVDITVTMGADRSSS